MKESVLDFFRKLWDFIYTKAQAKWAIKSGISALLAYFVGNWYGQFLHEEGVNRIISGLWCAVASIIVSQTHLGGSFKVGWIRFLGTFLGSILGGLFAFLLGATPLALGIGVTFAIMALSLLNLKSVISLTSVTLAVIMILWKLNPHKGPWDFALFRFLDACIGISIAIIVSWTLWPEKASRKMHLNLADILSSISKLFRKIAFFNHGETPIEEYEELYRKIEENLKKNILYIEEAKLEFLLNKPKAQNWLDLHQKCNEIADLVYTLRLIDKNSLKELQDIELSVKLENENLFAAFEESSLALKETSKIHFDLFGTMRKLDEGMKRLQTRKIPNEVSAPFVGNFFVFLVLVKEITKQMDETMQIINEIGRDE